jgi:hypothetical protein
MKDKVGIYIVLDENTMYSVIENLFIIREQEILKDKEDSKPLKREPSERVRKKC